MSMMTNTAKFREMKEEGCTLYLMSDGSNVDNTRNNFGKYSMILTSEKWEYIGSRIVSETPEYPHLFALKSVPPYNDRCVG